MIEAKRIQPRSPRLLLPVAAWVAMGIVAWPCIGDAAAPFQSPSRPSPSRSDHATSGGGAETHLARFPHSSPLRPRGFTFISPSDCAQVDKATGSSDGTGGRGLGRIPRKNKWMPRFAVAAASGAAWTTECFTNPYFHLGLGLKLLGVGTMAVCGPLVGRWILRSRYDGAHAFKNAFGAVFFGGAAVATQLALGVPSWTAFLGTLSLYNGARWLSKRFD